MCKKKLFEPTNLYFIIVSLVAIVILILPILLQIPCVYSFVKNYLAVFKISDYKNTYIGTLGTIYGAFLGVTGAIWVQNIASKQTNKEKSKKIANVIYYDFQNAVEKIKEIVFEMNGEGVLLVLPNDDHAIAQFRTLLSKKRIRIIPEWRQTVLSICEYFEPDELRQALVIYSMLFEIVSISNVSASKNDMIKLYSIMISMLTIGEKDSKLIESDEIKNVMDALNRILN